jgi:hypothetical protein
MQNGHQPSNTLAAPLLGTVRYKSFVERRDRTGLHDRPDAWSPR